MEGRIEHRHVLRARQAIARGAVGFQIVGIVERGQNAQLVDALLNIGVDDDRFLKLIAAVHDAMAHGIDGHAAELVEH